MRIEYDSERDLLYVYLGDETKKSVETLTIKEGVFVDFDKDGRLIRIEVLDASEVIGEKKIEILFKRNLLIRKAVIPKRLILTSQKRRPKRLSKYSGVRS